MENYRKNELFFYAKNTRISYNLRQKKKAMSVLDALNANQSANQGSGFVEPKPIRVVDTYEELQSGVVYLIFFRCLDSESVEKVVNSKLEYYFVVSEEDMINILIRILKGIYTESEAEEYKSFFEENKNLMEHRIHELNEIIEKGTYNLTLDKDFSILKVNEKFSSLFGGEGSCVGKGFFGLLHADEPAIVREEIVKKLAVGEVWEGRLNLVNSDEKSIFTIMTIIPLTNNNEEIIGYRTLVNEITELIKFLTVLEGENEAVQLENTKNCDVAFKNSRQAAMGELISMIAHQWRQPLSTISLIVSDLTLKSAFELYDREFFLDSFKKMEGHVEYMSTTIDDFRNFFKPNKKKESFKLSSVIESAHRILNDTLDSSEIYYHESIRDDFILTNYKSELLQVLLNIIKNSRDVIEERGVAMGYVYVSTRALSEKKFSIRIEDNGGGVKEELLGKIFEPYFSTKDEKNGTGLGLSMSRTIIEDHMGGSIRVSNTNSGALFDIILDYDEQVV